MTTPDEHLGVRGVEGQDAVDRLEDVREVLGEDRLEGPGPREQIRHRESAALRQPVDVEREVGADAVAEGHERCTGLAIVDGFTAAVNRYDTQAIRRLVTDNFMDYEGDRRTDRGGTHQSGA